MYFYLFHEIAQINYEEVNPKHRRGSGFMYNSISITNPTKSYYTSDIYTNKYPRKDSKSKYICEYN